MERNVTASLNLSNLYFEDYDQKYAIYTLWHIFTVESMFLTNIDAK
jgi:hypothetical protein